jgi:hypothetical protein
MCCQIDERDLFAATLGDLYRGRKVFLDRILEAHFASLRHVSCKKGCEDHRDRTDLEECVSIERPFVALFANTISDNAPAVPIDDADNDADALLLHIDPLGENAPDFGVGWYGAG